MPSTAFGVEYAWAPRGMDHQLGKGFEARSDAEMKIMRDRNKGRNCWEIYREEFEKIKYPENGTICGNVV